MIIDSAYIVQSQILSLGRIPFQDNKNIRTIFQPIFSSKSCFNDMRTIIKDTWRGGWEDDQSIFISLPDKPFIRKLGNICFNTRSARLNSSGACGGREILAELLGGRERYWDPSAKPKFLDYGSDNFFGYDKTLEDQRMNHLYFELNKPLFIKATHEGKITADGKIFLHIYPSGFIVFLIAVSFKDCVLINIENIYKAIRETRSGRYDNCWVWTSRLISGSLSDIVEFVKKNVINSILHDYPETLKQSNWHSALKLVTTDTQVEEYVHNFLKGNYEIFQLFENEYLISSGQGMICHFSNSYYNRRRRHLRLFWKFFTFFEYVILKNAIYDSYSDYLRSEIANLKEFRFSHLRKITNEDVFRLSVFNPNLLRYLQALDSHIKSANPFHRRIYSSLSLGMGFDKRRKKMQELVKQWENEIEKWEHGLTILWKKIISPLRSFLSG